MPSKAQPDVTILTATAEDGPACGQICYDAFSTISAAHGFPCDLPGPEAGIGLLWAATSSQSRLSYTALARSPSIPDCKTPELAVSSCRL
jgi:hypothetical protein